MRKSNGGPPPEDLGHRGIRLRQNGASADDRDPGHGTAPHDTKPFPGLRSDTGALAAERLYDPDQMRAIAFAFGQTMHMVSARYLVDGEAVEKLYEALGAIRKGAVKQQGQRLIGEHVVAARAAPVSGRIEQARGEADATRAERLTTLVRPELVRVVQQRELAVSEALMLLEERETDVDARIAAERERRLDLPPEERPRPDNRPDEPHPRGAAGVFERIGFGSKALAIVVPAELAVTTILLQGPISDLVATSTALDSYLIAAGVSGTLLGLGLVGGFAAAALRVSARVAAAVIVIIAGYLLARASHAMDLVRLGDEEGVALLTVSTLATVLIAGVTAYAQTRYKAHRAALPGTAPQSEEEVLELRLPLEHAVAVAVRRRDRAQRQLDDARAGLADAERELGEIDELIERLRVSADEAPLRVLGQERVAVEALAKAATVEATTNTALAQEDASLRACISAFTIAHRAIRATAYPEDGEPVAVATGPTGDGERDASRGMPLLHRLALGVLASGTVAGLVVPSLVPAGAGGLIAAVLWAWPARRRLGRRRGGGRMNHGPLTSTQPVTGAADERWREQPSSTTPKYERGGTPPTEEL